MKTSATRFFSLLGSLALLVATIFVFSALLRPAYKEINQLRGDLASRSELLDNQRRIVDEIGNLLDQYQSLAGTQEAISLALPNEEAYPTLMNQINALVRTSGLTLSSININLLPYRQTATALEGSNVPVVSVIQLNLALKGSYQALKSFLGALETNIRVMDLVSLNITPSQLGGQDYSFNMVVNAYYQTL